MNHSHREDPAAGAGNRQSTSDDEARGKFPGELQLRIARRVDELVRAGVSSSDLKLLCWLQAEEEILHPILLNWFARATVAAEHLALTSAQPGVQR